MTDDERIAKLKESYSPTAIDNGMRLRPGDFLDELEWRDRVDRHYARSWLDFTYGGLFMRKGLDERTRLLVSVAQFLAMGEMEELDHRFADRIERELVRPSGRVLDGVEPDAEHVLPQVPARFQIADYDADMLDALDLHGPLLRYVMCLPPNTKHLTLNTQH